MFSKKPPANARTLPVSAGPKLDRPLFEKKSQRTPGAGSNLTPPPGIPGRTAAPQAKPVNLSPPLPDIMDLPESVAATSPVPPSQKVARPAPKVEAVIQAAAAQDAISEAAVSPVVQPGIVAAEIPAAAAPAPAASLPAASLPAASAPASAAPVKEPEMNSQKPTYPTPPVFRPDLARPDSAKPDLARPEAMRSDPQRPGEPARQDQPRGEFSRDLNRRPETEQVKAEEPMRKLIVSRDITLSGEISACDVLVVEGTVEARVREARSIQISETGLFKGAVEMDEADIAGRFEGEITVRGRLKVRSTGYIDGKITYGELEVEAGGQLEGEISSLNSASRKKTPVADQTPARSRQSDPVIAVKV